MSEEIIRKSLRDKIVQQRSSEMDWLESEVGSTPIPSHITQQDTSQILSKRERLRLAAGGVKLTGNGELQGRSDQPRHEAWDLRTLQENIDYYINFEAANANPQPSDTDSRRYRAKK